MGLSEIPTSYMSQNAGGHVVVMESPKDKMSSKKKMHILKKIKKRFGLVRRSPTSCPGPNNLPPLHFHTVHGDNIRISRDGTLARRFESFCRAITFSARPVRINERICVKFAEISNNWNGGIRFGFTSNDPATLENALPKYACPDLTNRPGFWAKALHEQYCEKDNILYYYVNSAGDVIYGINNEEKGVILSGIDTRSLLWTIIDIYGNCTAIEFLDSRLYMFQNGNTSGGGGSVVAGIANSANGMNTLTAAGAATAAPGPQQIGLHPHHHAMHNQSRRSLPAEQDLERIVMPSMQSLNIASDHVAADMANGLPPLRYNSNGRLIPVPFHITKGRNVRLSQDRFIASRTESDFCQGYVFTARPIRIGEKIIVQILKTEQMYVGALALGLTSCNPAILQPADLPNDSDFLLDRPEYWVVSKDIASTPQRSDEIAFFVAPNGEVTISKNNGPAVVVMHVDQSLQLWAFLDVYGSTQSVRMFRQQLPNMVSYPMGTMPGNGIGCGPQMSTATTATSRQLAVNMPISESINSLNSQISESRKIMHPPGNAAVPSSSAAASAQQMNVNVTHSHISASSSTLASLQTSGGGMQCGGGNGNGSRMISMPSNGDMIQIQPNGGGTVLVVNLPPASGHSTHDLNAALSASQVAARNHQSTVANMLPNVGATSASSGGTIVSTSSCQYIEPISNTNGHHNNISNGKWKDTIDQHNADTNSTSAECTICYENQIDSVLYMCGHMCMCYDCAIEQWRGVGGGQCPLCRAVIRDVIRTYTT